MKKVKRLISLVLVLLFVFVSSPTSIAAVSFRYAPDYSKNKADNSKYMNYYFMEFCELQWYEETSESVKEWLKENGISFEVTKEGGYVTEIKAYHIRNDLYEISTSFASVTVEELTFFFNHDSGDALLSGASYMSPDSLPKIRRYYEHFYDVETEMIAEDTDYPCAMISGDYFIISVAQLSDSCYVYYFITPRTLYY